MSINSAMNAAVTALQAQGQNLSMISNNLANTSTDGYKAVTATFSTIMASAATANYYPSGGVISASRQSIYTEGNITSSSVSTDMAIQGNGMFIVTKTNSTSAQPFYTRDGEFSPDKSGYLTSANGGYYLMGWPTTTGGAVSGSVDTSTIAGLQKINITQFASNATPTTTASLVANLPADSVAPATFTESMQIYDSLGTAQSVPLTFVNNGSNTWTLSFGDANNMAVSPSNSSTETSGAISPSSVTLTFGTDGSLQSVNGSTTTGAMQLSIPSWTDGATPSDINLNLGTLGSTNGLTQYASGTSTPVVTGYTVAANGVAYGQMQSASVSTDGTVAVTYSNGQTVPIYKVALATFPNVNGLAATTGNVYEQTQESGGYALTVAGQNGTGSIQGSSLEQSNVDTSTEFTHMIAAQQAYSAASQIISTGKQMFQTLLQSVQG